MTDEYLWCDDQLRRPCDGVRVLRAERDRLAREHAALLRWADEARDVLAFGLPPVEHAHVVSAFTGEMEGRCRTCEIHELLAALDALTGGHQ